VPGTCSPKIQSVVPKLNLSKFSRNFSLSKIEPEAKLSKSDREIQRKKKGFTSRISTHVLPRGGYLQDEMKERGARDRKGQGKVLFDENK
jgi:hypothetical protein